MKKITVIAVTVASLILSGCGAGGESSNNSSPTIESIPEQTTVLINSAQSESILPENQIKTNTGYTHLSASGSRYSFE